MPILCPLLTHLFSLKLALPNTNRTTDITQVPFVVGVSTSAYVYYCGSTTSCGSESTTTLTEMTAVSSGSKYKSSMISALISDNNYRHIVLPLFVNHAYTALEYRLCNDDSCSTSDTSIVEKARDSEFCVNKQTCRFSHSTG